MKPEEILEIAQGAADAAAFEREALARIERAVGFDVAFFAAKPETSITQVGFTRAAFEACLPRMPAYERELAPLKEAALARRGVAIDTEVLGARRRELRYFRELAAPVGGRHSLMAYLVLRGAVMGGVMLGRCGGAFSDAARATMEQALPALAVARASFAGGMRTARAARVPAALTARERDVLEYLCLGFTNGEIARACGTAPHTVRNQLVRVFQKLGASTRAEAVAIALGGEAHGATR
jgi:DNA-binding CsgD family transcriptional regulator